MLNSKFCKCIQEIYNSACIATFFKLSFLANKSAKWSWILLILRSCFGVIETLIINCEKYEKYKHWTLFSPVQKHRVIALLSLGGDSAKSSSWRICVLQSLPSPDPAMIPAAMNYAWDPGTDYPYQYAILITLAKLPLNSYEYVENVWDPYSPPLLFYSFFFLNLKLVWKYFWKYCRSLLQSFAFLHIISLCFISGR